MDIYIDPLSIEHQLNFSLTSREYFHDSLTRLNELLCCTGKGKGRLGLLAYSMSFGGV